MNLRELLQAMADLGAGMSGAKEIYEATLGSLAEQLARSSVVDIPGVGSFSAHCTHRPGYQARNPFTGQPITVAARDLLRIRFAPDPALLAALEPHVAGAPPPGAHGPLHHAFLAALTSKWPEINLAGVGTFRTRKLPAQRERLHPRTGAVIAPAQPARRDVLFRPASKLKADLLPAFRRAPEDDDR